MPIGCTVAVATFRLHRDPVIYPNPEKFDPDHFLPEKSANRHYYAFVPFSAGPRSCVGKLSLNLYLPLLYENQNLKKKKLSILGRKYAMLKLKVILSTILRNFEIHADISEKDYKLQADIILKRAEGFKIRLEPRKRNRTSVA